MLKLTSHPTHAKGAKIITNQVQLSQDSLPQQLIRVAVFQHACLGSPSITSPPSLSPPWSRAMHSAMEQTRYWMWERNLRGDRKLVPGSQMHAYEQSWEERAFAEDSTGRLGYIWPPRSYSCSFCRREFRSAQALGGHMNVHRRDRARLKQSLSPTDDDSDHDPIQNSKLASSYSVANYSSTAPPLSPRVSLEVSTQALLGSTCFHIGSSLMDQVPATRPSVTSQELMLGRHIVDAEDNFTIKRRRIDHMFSMRNALAVPEKSPAEVHKHITCPVEELDLELRLGQKRKAVMVIE